MSYSQIKNSVTPDGVPLGNAMQSNAYGNAFGVDASTCGAVRWRAALHGTAAYPV